MKSITPDHLVVSREQGLHETFKRRPEHDPLLRIILGTAIGLSILVGVIAISWGTGPVLAETIWFIPLVSTFVSLTTLSVGYLALGRYQVLGDPVSFWTGMGFASLGIGHIFHVLTWPGLMPDGGAILAQLTNTPAFITDLNLTVFGGILLAAVLIHWPEKQTLVGRRWHWAAAAWLIFITFIFSFLTYFESYLPVLVRTDGTFTPLFRGSAVFLLFLFAAGSYLSTRFYQRSRDVLAGYVAFSQMALVFIVLMAIIGGKRYDLWWYLQRVIVVCGYLIVLFGLLSEYVRLFLRERESETRYRQLTESLPQLIWTCTPDGRCDYLSPQWVAYTGIPASPQLGLNWLERLHANDRQPAMEAWRAAVTAAADRTAKNFDFEFRIRRHDGEYRWFKTLALPIRDLEGQVTKWFGSCTDIEDWKRAEEALRGSELRYRGLFEAMREGLVVAKVITDENGNPVDYLYLDVNPTTERQFGISREQFVGHTFTEVLPDADPEWITILGNVALTGEPVSLEKYGRVTGLWFQCQAYSPRPGEVVNILTDITERKRAEEALKESQARLLDFLESTHDSFFALDRNWQIMFINQRFSQTIGREAVDLVGKNFWDEFPHYAGTPVETHYRKAMEMKVPVQFQSGGYYSSSWYDVSVYPTQEGIAVYSIDRTEEKQAEKALRESERRYHGLFETMQEALFAVEVITDGEGNPVDWRYVDVNPQTERFMGMSFEQLVGHTYSEVAPHPDPAWVALMGKVALTGAATTQEMYSPLRDRWLQVSVYSLRPGQAVGLFNDITERKLAEAALQKHTAELERANLELQYFTVLASHDLQEPLRKIEALGDAVLGGPNQLDERQSDLIQRMRRSAGQMRSMVNGLLQLSLLSTDIQSFQPVDLNQITTEILTDLEENLLQSGGSVEAGDLPVVEADPLQMRRLLQHLIENALKFQPPGGKPRVTVFSNRATPDFVQIIVKDNGIGFDEAHAAHLFEPFERLVGKNQPEYDGIGIGLAICRWIVERHGGKITASSKSGQGATFTVTLPFRSGLVRGTKQGR